MRLLPAALAGILVAASAGAELHRPLSPYDPPAVSVDPPRIVVKLGPKVTSCAHCLLKHGVPFESVTGSDSLDLLNLESGVRRARSVFFEHHALDGSRPAAYAARQEKVRRVLAIRGRSPAKAMPDLSNVFVFDLPLGSDPEEVAARYAADPDVEYAEPDHQVSVALIPDDPYFSSSGSWGQSYPDLWGLHAIDAASCWDVGNGAGTLVAVIDTGVDHNHADLAANMWTNAGEIPGNGIDDDANGFVDDFLGWDFDENDNTPNDRHGHGTHVAGTVAAVGDNGLGVVGVAWGARIMAVKGLGNDGYGSTSKLAAAIAYAAENGADVLNNSWGGYGGSLVIDAAIDEADALGAVVVAAAGNDGSNADFFHPARNPLVIAAGATSSSGAHASFSNHGKVLSVAAPGVNILSLRGAVSGPVGGDVVGGQYLRLAGTSMATPHVAGAAAVLRSVAPALTANEVRWHLELNADQPGYTGYEGEPWNPYLGWGRLDLGEMFTPPPITTRLDGKPLLLHAFAGSSVPDAGGFDFAFTTEDPVPWSVSGPSWLPPAPAGGDGNGSVTVSIDASALGIGELTDSLSVDAPSSADGGAALAATLYTHADPRIGSAVVAVDQAGSTTNRFDYSPMPRIASDGVGAVLVWATVGVAGPALRLARIDGGGEVSSSSSLFTGFPYKDEPVLASDGRNYLLVWIDADSYGHDNESIQAVRIAPDGTAIDAEPITIYTRRSRDSRFLFTPDVAFDGESYIVIWGDQKYGGADSVFMRRIGRDGSLRTPRRRKVLPVPGEGSHGYFRTRVACVTGSCLLLWSQIDSVSPAPVSKYIYNVHARRVVGDRVVDKSSTAVLNDSFYGISGLATDGQNYMILGSRINLCNGPNGNFTCGYEVIAGRVTPNGTPLDYPGIRVNNGPELGTEFAVGSGLTFDGENFVATFVGRWPGSTGPYQFGARITPAGVVLENEAEGALLRNESDGWGAAVAGTRTHSVLAWKGAYAVDVDRVYAQRAFAHPPAPALPNSEIGGIGPRTVAENGVLSFTVSAPGLDPGSTTFSAAHLPPGAVFDAPTATFRWKPTATEAGWYPDVHFEAADAVSAVSEDVDVTVLEGALAISGTVRDSGGTPMPGVAIKIRGTAGGARTGFSDADGRFWFTDLVPRKYVLRLGKPSTKEYRAEPRRIKVDLGSSDVTGAQFIVTPK